MNTKTTFQELQKEIDLLTYEDQILFWAKMAQVMHQLKKEKDINSIDLAILSIMFAHRQAISIESATTQIEIHSKGLIRKSVKKLLDKGYLIAAEIKHHYKLSSSGITMCFRICNETGREEEK